MTSIRQIEANRRNAIRSTGPNTDEGKRRSRRNAIRHGLCAETVIDNIEDIEDYRAFEAAVIADYEAVTVVERELVLRLASLLWRLRRATAIETELLRIQAEILRERREQARPIVESERPPPTPFRLSETVVPLVDEFPHGRNDSLFSGGFEAGGTTPISALRDIPVQDLAHCFQRLARFDNGLFERLGRYETMLWRQMVQAHLLLQSARRL